jgi:hypothetical protein
MSGAARRAPTPCPLSCVLCPLSSDVPAGLMLFRPFGLIQKDQKITAAAKPAAPALRERNELNSARRMTWLLHAGLGSGGPQTVIRSFRSLRSGAETPVSREAGRGGCRLQEEGCRMQGRREGRRGPVLRPPSSVLCPPFLALSARDGSQDDAGSGQAGRAARFAGSPFPIRHGGGDAINRVSTSGAPPWGGVVYIPFRSLYASERPWADWGGDWPLWVHKYLGESPIVASSGNPRTHADPSHHTRAGLRLPINPQFQRAARNGRIITSSGPAAILP